MNTIIVKTWHTQEAIFEYKDENATLKEAVEEAIRQGISLAFADLKGDNLKGANLNGTILRGANLKGADLKNADLSNTNLCDADLRGADLKDADLSNASLLFADLRGANLKGAKFQNVNLYKAKGISDGIMPLACPTEGSFIAWKKVDSKLIKLEIPEDAKRSSATTKKCRCSKAKVLAITNLEETESFDEVFNDNYAPLTYKVGEMVYPDSFDENRWLECSNGIHFFMNKEDALNW